MTRRLSLYAYEGYGAQLEYIKPGKSALNAFIESFNGMYRPEILDFYLCRMLNETRGFNKKMPSSYKCTRHLISL
jgi:putative transposase